MPPIIERVKADCYSREVFSVDNCLLRKYNASIHAMPLLHHGDKRTVD